MRFIPVAADTLPGSPPASRRQRESTVGDAPPLYDDYDFNVSTSTLTADGMATAGFSGFTGTFKAGASFFLMDIMFTDPSDVTVAGQFAYVYGFGLRIAFGSQSVSASVSGSIASWAASASLQGTSVSATASAPGLASCPLTSLLPLTTESFNATGFLALAPVISQFMQWIAAPENRSLIQPEIVGYFFVTPSTLVQNAAASFGVARRAVMNRNTLSQLYSSLPGLSKGLPNGVEFEDVVFQSVYTTLVGPNFSNTTQPTSQQGGIAHALDSCGP
jgi:hypothetical protein